MSSERDGDRLVANIIEIIGHNIPIGEIRDALYYSLSEVVNNVFHHAELPTHGVICAQYYPNRHCVELAVVDSGRGISESLRGNPELEFSTTR